MVAPPLFSALPDPVQAELKAGSVLRQFEPGQLIQQRGEDPVGFWHIESGSVAVGQYLASGEFRGVALLTQGDSWGELALFAARPRMVDAVARTECALRHIRADRLEAALQSDPASMRSMLGVLSRQLHDTLEVVAAIRRGSAHARIAGVLVTLYDSGKGTKRIALTQHELGELLGLTRASVNAGLRAFEQRSLIKREYGAVEILDRDGLALEAHA